MVGSSYRASAEGTEATADTSAIERLILAPPFLIGQPRFVYLSAALSAADFGLNGLGWLGLDIVTPPRSSLDTIAAFAIFLYVAVANVVAVSVCAGPTYAKLTGALVLLIPKLLFVLLDASTFFALGVWVTVVQILILATVRGGVTWEVVDITEAKR